MAKLDINGKLWISVFEIRGWRGIAVIIKYEPRYNDDFHGFSSFLKCTGLFKMTVGGLTTCHTQTCVHHQLHAQFFILS